jgi:Fip1 motif
MGRKKRKVDSATDVAEETASDGAEQPPVEASDNVASGDSKVAESLAVAEKETKPDETGNIPISSAYAMSSHSGEIVQEDIYVSDGSVDSDDADGTEIVLTGSRMGIMRRGLHHQMMALQQPNRQWKRQDATTISGTAISTINGEENDGAISKEQAEEMKRQLDEELALLDPAQRAARLLLEKQRREAEAKIEERRLENEENVMRDATLFSKRTAFDIRFDQIDDKPWHRGTGTSDNLSEFFNYGLSEEDWLEYAEQQLIIRQELIDAFRQKRSTDPTIVPIQPRAKTEEDGTIIVAAPIPQDATIDEIPMDTTHDNETVAVLKDISIGPTVMKPDETVSPQKLNMQDFSSSTGGAWGAGAVPGSLLARLMEAQESGESPVGDSSKLEIAATRSEEGRRDGDDANRYRSKAAKPERDYSRYSRRGNDGEADGYYSVEGDEYQSKDEREHRGGGPRYRPPPPPPAPGWLPPPQPQIDSYPPFPPPSQGGGYRGGGRGRGRGAGRGGGYYDRDTGGRGYKSGDYGGRGGGDHSGWKRPRN